MEVPREPFRFFCLKCSKAYNRELICHGEKVVDSASADYLPKQKTIIMNEPYLSGKNSDEQLNITLENNLRVVHERQLLERIKQNVMLDKKISIEVHDEKKQNQKVKKEPLNDYEKVEETQTSSGDQKFKCGFCEFKSDNKKATSTHFQMVHEWKKQEAIKPKMSYDDLIVEALNNSSNGMLEVSDIYNAISTKYPYYKLESKSWQNCIRHNLSLSNIFVKEGNTKGGNWKLNEKEFMEFKKAREVKHTNRLKQQEYEIKQKQKYVKTVHNGIIFDCIICGKPHMDKEDLSKHISEIHEGNQPSFQRHDMLCYICNEKYLNFGALKNHIELVHEGKKTRDENPKLTCEFESDDQKATTAHVQIVHEGEKHDAIKPKMPYDDLIAEALNNSSNGMLEVSDIYNAISTKYPYYKIESKSWQNCIRHNLSLSNLFVKEGKSTYWKLDEKEFIKFKKAREVKQANRLKQQQYEIERKQKYVRTVHEKQQQYEIKQKHKYVRTVHEGKKTRGEKPKMSFEQLIIEALNSSLNGMLNVSDIYKAISTKYSYYQMEKSRISFSNWQNSVRHCLWVSKKFVKEDKGQ